MTKKDVRLGSHLTSAAPGASPWPRRLGIGAGASFVLLLVATVALNSPPERGIPEGTEKVDVPTAVHVEGDIHVDEEDVPPGGPHSAVWQNCGFYTREVRSENAVHSLEHGAIWITYREDLAAEEIDRLRRFARPPDKILISPIAGQDSPVVATAWAYRLEVGDATDPRLAQFVNEFEGRGDAPEPGGRCSGGIG